MKIAKNLAAASYLLLFVGITYARELDFYSELTSALSYTEDQLGLRGTILSGTYPIDASLSIAKSSHDTESVDWDVSSYTVNYEVQISSPLFETPAELLIETSPLTAVSLREPLKEAWADYLSKKAVLTTRIDGSWELHGALIRSVEGSGADGGSTVGVVHPGNAVLLASGTYTGNYDKPLSFEVLSFQDGWSALPLVSNFSLVSVLVGDIDRDREVSFADFLAFSSRFGDQCDACAEDLNSNGVVDFADFLDLSENFGKSVFGAVSVPEPRRSGVMSILLALLLGSSRHRRRS